MQPDAITNPNAVVVHAHYAALALRTVMGPRRLHSLANVASFIKLVIDDVILPFRELVNRSKVFVDELLSLGF